MPNVTTQHPEYTEALPKWRRCRDLIEGSDKVKAGSPYGGVAPLTPDQPRTTIPGAVAYLPTPPGMSSVDFEFYKARAQFFNAMSRTSTALTGTVFTKPPVVKSPDSIKEHLEDLTLLDEPLDVVAQRITNEVLDVGRYAIFLDMPPEVDGSPEARPYWVTIPAERIINWKTGQVGPDPDQLTMVVFREDVPASSADEFSHQTVAQYKQLALVEGLYQVRVWTQSETSKEYGPGPWIIPTRRKEQLKFIPFTFVGVDGVSPCVSKPPLVDLADVNIGHFRNSADLEAGLFSVAIPIPVAIGAADNTALKTGASVVWTIPAGGDAKMLEFTGQGLGTIKAEMKDKERLMATLGARLLDDPSQRYAETATAVRMRVSGEGASLRTIAGSVSTAMTTVLRWHVWWFQGTGDFDQKVTVTLSQEFFDVRATADEVTSALQALLEGKISNATWYDMLQRGGWAREGVSFEDEQAEIAKDKKAADTASGDQANALARAAIEKAMGGGNGNEPPVPALPPPAGGAA